jgi:hypothetical protein
MEKTIKTVMPASDEEEYEIQSEITTDNEAKKLAENIKKNKEYADKVYTGRWGVNLDGQMVLIFKKVASFVAPPNVPLAGQPVSGNQSFGPGEIKPQQQN